MKNMILIVSCLIITNSAFSQTQKGSRNLGVSSNIGNIISTGPYSNSDFGSYSILFGYKENGVQSNDTYITAFNIQPAFGYFLKDGLMVRANMNLFSQKDIVEENVNGSTFVLMLGPELKYYFGSRTIRPYIGGILDFGWAKITYTIDGVKESPSYNLAQLRLEGGVAVFIGQHISIDLGIGISNMWQKTNGVAYYRDSYQNIGINLGVNFFF
jgi:hypothetical protein